MRRPARYFFGGADVAVARNDAAHPGGVGGLHVAQVVAEIQALCWGDADDLAGFEHRFGMRFGMSAGVAADQAGGAVGIAQGLHQRNGETMRFVGDDAPSDIAPFQFGDQLCHAAEQPRMHADVARVIVEEDVAQRVVVGMFRLDAKTGLEQAARAVRGLRANHLDGQRRLVARAARVIERCGKVGRGVGKGAVEVEKDGFNHEWLWRIA